MIIITPFEKLSNQERNLIEKWVDTYAFVMKHDTPTIDLEYRLRFWNRNKQWLFDAFGQELILEKEIDIEGSESIGKYRIDTELSHYYFVHQLDEYIHYTEKYPLLNTKDLYNNKYSGDPYTITINNKKIKVEKGCKLNRVFHKIAKAIDNKNVLENYEEFSNFLSQCSNQRRIKGTLCLSIHPMDYFTASDNLNGWDSCFSWWNNGGYSSSTIGAMNCPTVVMAYIKSSKESLTLPFLNNEPVWNSKRWREFFIVDPEAILGIKGYPWENEELEKICLQWIADLLQFEDKKVYAFTSSGNCVEKDFKAHVDICYMYDDFHRGGAKQGCINTKERCLEIDVAQTLSCIACGKQNDLYEDHKVCLDCEHIVYCDDCDEAILFEDAVIIGDCHICPECYNANYYTCSGCGKEDVYIEDIWFKDGEPWCENCYFPDEEEDEIEIEVINNKHNIPSEDEVFYISSTD